MTFSQTSKGLLNGKYKAPTVEDMAEEPPALKLGPPKVNPGEYWLIQEEGNEDWPGVVCDEDLVLNHFNSEPRLNDAKQPNGERIRPHGKSLNEEVYPMMYLGKLKLCWVPRNRLRLIDRNVLARKRDATENDLLRTVYTDVLRERDLNYWKDYVKSEILVRSMEEDDKPIMDNTSQEHKISDTASLGRKRKYKESRPNGRHRFPQSFDVDNNKDDDESYLSWLKKIKRGLKVSVKRELADDICVNNVSPIDHDALHEDLTSEDSVTHRRCETSNGRFSSRLETPSMTPATSREQSGPDLIKVYVGNPHSVFAIKYESLRQQSKLLFDGVRLQGKEWYLMHPVLSELSALDFGSVAEYLNHSEFKPNLLHEGTDRERLENMNSEDDMSAAIIQCGYLYGIAQKLELPGLQDLCFRKLKALPALPSEELVLIAKRMFSSWQFNDRAVRDYFVECIAKKYYTLWEEDSKDFRTLLTGCSELAMAIHKRLGDGIEMEKPFEKIEDHSEGAADDS